MRQQRRIGQARELDPRDAVAEAFGRGGGDDARQPALADAAGADDGDEAVRFEQCREQGDLVGAAEDSSALRCRFARRARIVGRPVGVIVDLGAGLVDRFQQRGDEPVAAPGNRRDRVRAEEPAQARDLHRQVVLLDDHPRPHDLEQLVLRHDPVSPLDQREQQVERARTDLAVASVDAQDPPGALQLGSEEAIGCRGHRRSDNGLRSTPVGRGRDFAPPPMALKRASERFRTFARPLQDFAGAAAEDGSAHPPPQSDSWPFAARRCPPRRD
jgi:hypothetical protein